MRAGYGARGAIYVTVGVLAFYAALTGSSASGTKDALAALRAQPWGAGALVVIGIGMFAYLIWRVVAGVADVDDQGTDPKGLFSRFAQIVTGLLHGGVGFSVLSLARGGGSGGDAAEDWTATVMQAPAGRYMIAAVALIFASAGVYYALKGWRGGYKDHLRSSRFTQWVSPALTGGLVVYGALLMMVGVSLGFAALNADPEQAGGLGQALQSLREAAFGRFLLAGAGLGLLGFALYNFVEAKYRIIPRIAGPDVKTLAKRAMT